MKSIRMDKISEQIRRELSQMIQQDLSEKYGVITITRVYITPDIKEAKIYFSCLNKGKEADVLKDLTRKALSYQHTIGRKLQIKFTPRFTFVIDNYQDDIDKVEGLLTEIDHGA